jgi:hypothetical protein
MTHSIHSAAMLEALLDVIEHERFVRAPLLWNLGDELAAAKLARASALAWSLAIRVECGAVSDSELSSAVAKLRDAVHASSRSTRVA